MTGQWHGGKGSRPRKMSVDTETFNNNWERIFGKKDKKSSEQENQQKTESGTTDQNEES